MKEHDESFDINGRQIKLAIGVILTLIVLFNSFEIIDSGYRGLRFTWGALDDQVVSEGLAFKIPVAQKIKEVTIRPQQLDFAVEVGPQGAITKDNQNIGASMTVFFRYKADQLVNMWRDVGVEKMESIIQKTTGEDFKQEIGRYTIFEIAPTQEKIRANVFDVMKTNLATYPIEVTELKVTNYDWSDAFEHQIEETMTQAQKVRQKEQELLIAEQEAQKKVKQAQADKESAIKVAEGEKESARLRADAKVLEGEGIRKFNESIRASRDIEMQLRQLEIEKLRVSKWNGQYVPNNMYGPIPFSSGGVQGQK